MKSRSPAVFRRYPALSYLAVAAALALLLPSGLTIPQSGPPTLAEYAPVPGEGDGEGAVSDLGTPSSSGIGAGKSVGVQEQTAKSAGDRRIVRKPGTKRCVGKPPRQTESRLSPACVAFFEGDNGGATSKGVSRDEVTVVIYYPGANKEFIDCGQDYTTDDDTLLKACRAYMRFFNERYQTYGRTVRLWVFRSPAQDTNGHQANFSEIASVKQPFAVGFEYDASTHRSNVFPKARILAVVQGGASRDFFSQYAPYMISLRPDQDDFARIAASYVCSKLVGRRAKYSGTETLKIRKFGLLEREVTRPVGDALVAQLERICDLKVAMRAATPEKLQAEGVTTVITTYGSISLQVAQASSNGWYPEWFNSDDPGQIYPPSLATSARNNDPLQWSHSFGIMFDYRRDGFVNQDWYQAYKEGCPGCDPEFSMEESGLFDNLGLLFYGIQAAGPRLTPDALGRGLHSISADRSSDPYKPAAYFAPGNWTFVKDAAEIWWDPQGEAPDEPQPGCYRLVDGGRRFRAGEWTAGDDEIQKPQNAPCQGPAGSVR